MINLRLPNITAQDERGKLEQIRSYLYQFAQELNWALSNIDSKAEEATQRVEATTAQKDAVEQAQATFSEVKSLIIKSADIVNAYYDAMSYKLNGEYVAQSDFGTYMQDTSLTINGNSTSIGLMFDNQQVVSAVVQPGKNETTIIGSEAWCKIGLLSDDNEFPIYGMEIGQVNTNGDGSHKSFARYQSDGVHLFDQNGIEVATIIDSMLNITNAKIKDSLMLGGYAISTNNGLEFKWAGG